MIAGIKGGFSFSDATIVFCLREERQCILSACCEETPCDTDLNRRVAGRCAEDGGEVVRLLERGGRRSR